MLKNKIELKEYPPYCTINFIQITHVKNEEILFFINKWAQMLIRNLIDTWASSLLRLI